MGKLMETIETTIQTTNNNGKPSRLHWSDGSQLCFIDGHAYGVDSSLRTVYLGKEADVLVCLKKGNVSNDLTPRQRAILVQVQKLENERQDKEKASSTKEEPARKQRNHNNNKSRNPRSSSRNVRTRVRTALRNRRVASRS